MIVFDRDQDAEEFAADMHARQVAPGGKSRLTVGYGSGRPGAFREAVVTVVRVEAVPVMRPEDSGRPEDQRA